MMDVIVTAWISEFKTVNKNKNEGSNIFLLENHLHCLGI